MKSMQNLEKSGLTRNYMLSSKKRPTFHQTPNHPNMGLTNEPSRANPMQGYVFKN
ncbi:hypothetical protein HMPREF0281_02650 [Corynebacterium ammoniagenes DSM 20306]|uniref:Uncharacterized protein n=1 Tax=Corynebacterium ammoniagenes DSM 20306 TaxID=649754 RepID=A0ABP2IFH5_CORAM|nr:hypothetical protein HMPREF0281_02650 [Corynebacterium ammoniagenes DSM 20306]